MPTATVICFIYMPSITVYIMGGVCLLNCIIMMLNEKKFLFNSASRSAVVDLMETKKLLDGRMSSLTDEIEILERGVARYVLLTYFLLYRSTASCIHWLMLFPLTILIDVS